MRKESGVIRIVADTNVYVSAIVFGGTCEEILTLARAGIVEIKISLAIQRELRRVLRTGFQWTGPQIREALTEVETLTSPVHHTVKLAGVVHDDDDHRILECAVAADAEFLVTGDKKDLLPLHIFREIRIVSPREFLDLFR